LSDAWGRKMTNTDLTLSYKLDRDDYWAALAKINRQSSWRVVGVGFGVWMILGFVGSFYILQAGFKASPLELATLSIYGLLGLTLLAALILRFASRFSLNRALASSEAGPLAQNTLGIGAEGISWEDGNTKIWYNWGAFERIEVTDRLVLLYSSPVQAIMIPRRVLGDEESMGNFVASAREHIIAAQR
jgi:YcxB-like protein